MSWRHRHRRQQWNWFIGIDIFTICAQESSRATYEPLSKLMKGLSPVQAAKEQHPKEVDSFVTHDLQQPLDGATWPHSCLCAQSSQSTCKALKSHVVPLVSSAAMWWVWPWAGLDRTAQTFLAIIKIMVPLVVDSCLR